MIAITRIVGELFDLVKGQPLGHSVVISNGLSDRTVEVSDEFIMMVLMLKRELDENTPASEEEEGPGPQPQVYSAPVPQKAKAGNGQRQTPPVQRPAPAQQPEDENEVYADPDTGASSL